MSVNMLLALSLIQMLFLMYWPRSTTKTHELWWSGVMTSRQIGERKLLDRGRFHEEIVLCVANHELVKRELFTDSNISTYRQTYI